MSTSDPIIRRCRMCGKPEHGSLSCDLATDWTISPPTPEVGSIKFGPSAGRPHKCPICEGCGTVPNDFYARLGVSTSTGRETCRTCVGTGVLWSLA